MPKKKTTKNNSTKSSYKSPKKTNANKGFPNFSHHPDKVQMEHDLVFVFLIFLFLGIVGALLFFLIIFVKSDGELSKTNKQLDDKVESTTELDTASAKIVEKESVYIENLFENDNYLFVMEDYDYDHPLKSEACYEVISEWTTLIYFVDKKSGERYFLYDWCSDSLSPNEPVFAEDENNIYFAYSYYSSLWDIIKFDKENKEVEVYGYYRVASELINDIEGISGETVWSVIQNPEFILEKSSNDVGIEFDSVFTFLSNIDIDGNYLELQVRGVNILGEDTVIVKDVDDEAYSSIEGKTYDFMFERIK